MSALTYCIKDSVLIYDKKSKDHVLTHPHMIGVKSLPVWRLPTKEKSFIMSQLLKKELQKARYLLPCSITLDLKATSISDVLCEVFNGAGGGFKCCCVYIGGTGGTFKEALCPRTRTCRKRKKKLDK